MALKSEGTRARGAHLQLAGIAKRYGPVLALAPTDLEVQPGEFFSLIGPSGSGKTTLLGTIAGFVPPSAGSLRVNGTDLVRIPPYRRNIGMVFQHYSLFPHMTVAENIGFPLRMRKLPAADIGERVQRMLAMVRLRDFGPRMPSQLSGGQQQRVALARAAVYDPPLLLMDEPLGALDKNLREEMQFEIKQFHEQIGATVIYVTHDQDEAASMSDRIAILNRARIVQTGPPRELYEQPRDTFVASFLGEANLLRVAGIDSTTDGGCVARTQEGFRLHAATPADHDADRLAACVRPENIHLLDAGEQADNIVPGTVADVVYTAGTVRYRVRVADEVLLTVKLPSRRQADTLHDGAAVRLGWSRTDTLLIPERGTAATS